MYTVFINFENGDSTEQFDTQDAGKAEDYADDLATRHPEYQVFIAGPNDSYLNRDGHAPVGKKW